jgi:ribosomal protein S18 acetylase RimI-like enzyme
MEDMDNAVEERIFLRQGPIYPDGAYFTQPGFSTYSDQEIHQLDLYRDLGLRLVTSETPEAGRVLQRALRLAKEDEDKARIQEAIDNNNFIDYMLNDEVPAIIQAAKVLKFDGITVQENDDLPGSPTSSFIWRTDLLDLKQSATEIPPLDWTPGLKDFHMGHSSIFYRVHEAAGAPVDLESLRTLPGKRNQGSASKLVTHFLSEADKQGLAVKVIASPLDDSTNTARLAAFYEKFGFARTGETVNAYHDPVLKRRALPASTEANLPPIPHLAAVPTSGPGQERSSGAVRESL